jgi:hypothetical protein
MRTIEEGLDQVRWTSPTEFELDGLTYLMGATHLLKTTAESIPMLKWKEQWLDYAEALGRRSMRNVLEIGLWQGGSALAFSSLLQPDRLVAIDICDPVLGFDEVRAQHPSGRPIRVHYQTSQDDEARLNEIIATEFDGPIDLVIDDGSHDYALTRRSFEIVFPHLAPGGLYVIEDWGWAHAKGFRHWEDKPALSNLIFELLMVNAGSTELIDNINVFLGFAAVRKSAKAAVGEPLTLDGLYCMQNRTFALL